jgi:hypothetical protein
VGVEIGSLIVVGGSESKPESCMSPEVGGLELFIFMPVSAIAIVVVVGGTSVKVGLAPGNVELIKEGGSGTI